MYGMKLCAWAFTAMLIAMPLGRNGEVLAAGGPVAVPGALPPEVRTGQAQVLAQKSGADVIRVTIGLPLRDRSGLDQYLRAVSDPTSPSYQQYLTQDQANQRFNPSADQENRAVSWLQAHGLTTVHTYPNHLLIDVQGTVSQFEKLLLVSINTYQALVHGKQATFFSPDRNPTVDSSVSDVVSAVIGLDNYPRFFHSSNGSAHNTPAYYPQDYANAYNVQPLWTAGNTGAGQHIGITLFQAPPSDATLQQFASTTGANVATAANGRFKLYTIDGGTTSPDDGEASMDTEYTSGMAPGATIDYYNAPNTGQGLIDALNTAGTDANNNRQISNSWGECEPATASDAFVQQTNTVLASNSSTGHNYFFSTGDSGSTCGTSNPMADFPASSPYVTAVGGTTFSSSINGTYPGETTWTYNPVGNSGSPQGSGGGYSAIFGRPSWQTGGGLAANAQRGYPDVAAAADPNTGAYVCFGSSGTPNCSSWFGGTSLSSPLWAGMAADLNSYLAAHGKPFVGFFDPTIYSLATKSQPFAPFHDVVSGTNGTYTSGPGWDAVTGWGSPNLYNIAQDLAGNTVVTPTPTPIATNTTPPSSTPTPTSTATNTPVPSGGQLIVNGGFEQGQSPWQESTSPARQLITGGMAHSGTAAATLCGVNICNQQIWQTIALPTSFSGLTVSYWYSVSSQDFSTSCTDALRVWVRTSAGTNISAVQTLCNTNRTTGWVQRSVDLTSILTPYRGQHVQVDFAGSTNATSPSTFLIDDVSVLVSGAGSASPTPTSTATPTSTSTAPPTSTPTATPTVPSSSGSCPGSQSACIQAALNQINTDRAQYGKAPLSLNLTQTNGTPSCVGSYGHSVHMAQMGTISHDQFPADICVAYSTAGENVGEAGYGNTLTDLQQLNSSMMGESYSEGCRSNHKCNLLYAGYHQVGIGIYSANNVTWLTEDFVN